MFLLMFAAIGGGIATAMAVAPFGTILGLLSAPFGGSLCTVLAAVYLAHQRGNDRNSRANLDEQADAMVAALQGMAANGARSRRADDEDEVIQKSRTKDVKAA